MRRSTATFSALTAAILVTAAGATAYGTVFFTDGFDYADGQLTAHNSGADVSGGLWTTHSPTAVQTPTTSTVQVLGGEAVVKASGAEDVSRSTNAVIPEGGTWYFGAKFKVNAGTNPLTATPFYFMHLKDEGTFSFRSRIYVKQPNTASTSTYTLGLSAGSLTGGGALVPWTTGDFNFGDTVTIIGRYTSADGIAETPDEGFGQLWVNPTSQASDSIIDSNPNPASITDDAMSRLALRQAGAGAGQPDVLVNIVSVGDSFAEVLAALNPVVGQPGDFTGDSKVLGDDFLKWQRDLGDAPNLALWKANYGVGAAVPAIGAVPEPASVGIAALGLALGFAARRRRTA